MDRSICKDKNSSLRLVWHTPVHFITHMAFCIHCFVWNVKSTLGSSNRSRRCQSPLVLQSLLCAIKIYCSIRLAGRFTFQTRVDELQTQGHNYCFFSSPRTCYSRPLRTLTSCFPSRPRSPSCLFCSSRSSEVLRHDSLMSFLSRLNIHLIHTFWWWFSKYWTNTGNDPTDLQVDIAFSSKYSTAVSREKTLLWSWQDGSGFFPRRRFHISTKYPFSNSNETVFLVRE